MTDMSIAQAGPVLVAIDNSKARHEVLIAVPGKKRRRRLTVLNQLDGLQPADCGSLRNTATRFAWHLRRPVATTGHWRSILAVPVLK